MRHRAVASLHANEYAQSQLSQTVDRASVRNLFAVKILNLFAMLLFPRRPPYGRNSVNSDSVLFTSVDFLYRILLLLLSILNILGLFFRLSTLHLFWIIAHRDIERPAARIISYTIY